MFLGNIFKKDNYGRHAAVVLLLFYTGLSQGQTKPADSLSVENTEEHITDRDRNVVPISRLEGEIEFDGLPFEAAWDGIETFPMTTHSPYFGSEPVDRSEVMIAYDQQYLWVGARLYHTNPNTIVSASKKRDERSRNSDSFGLILDTFDDNENALAFFTMPSGLRADFAVSNDASGFGFGAINYNWNTFWDVKTSMDDEGWYVEMRIPFSSLPSQDVDGIVKMGLIINRTVSYSNEIHTYPPIDPKYGRTAAFKPSQSQTIDFKNIKPRKPIYLSPSLTGGFSQDWKLNEEKTGYVKSSTPNLEPSLDLKYNITSNLTVDVTANTDFAQVEADDQQVNLTRFSQSFPEKRRFFQERSSNFDFDLGGPSRLFYSRSIGIGDNGPVRIYGGARLVGRVNKWDVGFLNMQTEAYGDNPSDNFGVARLRRQVINPNSYVGGILTSKLGTDGSYNIAYGFDGIFRIFGDDYVQYKVAQTRESGKNYDVLSPEPSFFSLLWERRSEKGFGYDLSYSYLGEQFNPGVGFLLRRGNQGMNTRLQYGWFPGANSFLFSHKVQVWVNRTYRLSDGKLESARISPGWFFSTKSGFGGGVQLQFLQEDVLFDYSLSDAATVLAGNYSYVNNSIQFNTPFTNRMAARVQVNAGGFFDGRRVSFEIRPTVNIGSSLQFSGYYEMNAIDFPERNQHYRGHLARLKLLYMYNTKLSASSFIQYNNSNDDFLVNFRLRYNPREGNDFYVVFNDERFVGNGLGVPEIEMPPFYNQTILLKYTYTFSL